MIHPEVDFEFTEYGVYTSYTLVPTLIAVDAREALVQIAAGKEALEHLSLDRPVDEAGRLELLAMSPNTLI